MGVRSSLGSQISPHYGEGFSYKPFAQFHTHNKCLGSSFFRTVPPTTMAALTNARFLMIYCPSIVRPHGIWVKQTSGSSTSGSIVPGICNNKRRMETRINGRHNMHMPINTSHQPSIGMNTSGGNQYTVLSTNSAAGLTPRGFNSPNQMNTTASEYLSNRMPHFSIQPESSASNLSNSKVIVNLVNRQELAGSSFLSDH